MKKFVAQMIRNYFGDIKIKKRLPKEFGGGSLYVVPKSDMRCMYPGLEKMAPDLMEVVRRFLIANSQTNDVVVWDIGSNQGIFSVLAAGVIGRTGKVLSVEADHYYTCLQEKTISKLPEKYGDITVLCTAISDSPDILKFNVSAQGHARSHLDNIRSSKESKHIFVTSTTLDNLIKDFGNPCLVKIDIEGAETLALNGATKLLKEIRPIFYIEVSEENSVEITNIFKKFNYQTLKLHLDKAPTLIQEAEMYTVAVPI